jgi:hypothetical protein
VFALDVMCLLMSCVHEDNSRRCSSVAVLTLLSY